MLRSVQIQIFAMALLGAVIACGDATSGESSGYDCSGPEATVTGQGTFGDGSTTFITVEDAILQMRGTPDSACLSSVLVRVAGEDSSLSGKFEVQLSPGDCG